MAEAVNATDSEPGLLTSREIWWRDHQVWLQECGYMLRPRYMPDWVPSWHHSGRRWYQSEDGKSMMPGVVLDAVRIRDKADVSLKRIDLSTHPLEHIIGKQLSHPSATKHPENHSVPILEVLDVPDSDTPYVIIVMPLLRKFTDPRFDTYGEAVDFIGQVFEGMKFLHDHKIAHRDCNGSNIMMECSKMYPEGFHPRSIHRKRDFYSGAARFYTRTQRPPRYYLIDFGLSRVYRTRDPPPLEPIIIGGDKSPPEFKIRDENGRMRCDPFPTDVYYLGNMIKTHFLDGRKSDDYRNRLYGFEFMRSLVNDMTAEDPAKRPDMNEVAERFAAIRKGLSSWKLRSRVVKAKDPRFEIFRSIFHWGLRIEYILRRMPAIPTPPSTK